MSGSLKEFNNWCRKEEGKRRYFHNHIEYEMAKAGWKAALDWVKRELYAARDGFEPDLGLHNLLERELNAKTQKEFRSSYDIGC